MGYHHCRIENGEITFDFNSISNLEQTVSLLLTRSDDELHESCHNPQTKERK